jgi:hypothetical protein
MKKIPSEIHFYQIKKLSLEIQQSIMSKNPPSPNIPNSDLDYSPEKNSRPDLVGSEPNKNDPQYTQ